MFRWIRRRQASVAPPADLPDRDLQAWLEACPKNLAEAAADNIVAAFTEVLSRRADRSQNIPDASELPFPKKAIRWALARKIQFHEEQAKVHQTAACYVSDYQEIDEEDMAAVREANAGQLDNRRQLLLVLKYQQRGMKEDGLPLEDPLEADGQRISFQELCQRFGIAVDRTG